MDCVFCKIAKKEIPSQTVYEDEKIVIFKDLEPVAPIHLLAIPKVHIESANEINLNNSQVISRIFEVIANKSNEFGLENGFRIVNNCGKFGGQTVMHLHFHILGGKALGWPPV